jgi:hypothetical protein
MSSHREAPEISKDPVADSTDLYAFVSPDNPNTVTIVANYIPLEAPAGGPNFYEFGNDVRYEILIDNNGDGVEEITYRFTFKTDETNPNTFLYNTGPIASLTDKNWNRRQSYTVSRIDGPRTSGTETVLATDVPTPPVRIGPRSTPNYETLADSAIRTLPNGEMVFAGQRADAFFVDLGSIFDLGALRPVQNLHLIPLAAAMGVNSVAGHNVHSIVLQIPKTLLTADGSNPSDVNSMTSVIGAWTAASRQMASVRETTQTSASYHQAGPWQQVSRLGHPLINEVLIPMGMKDTWNANEPSGDGSLVNFYEHPELAGLLPVLYPNVFPNLAAYTKPRADLVAILLTGIPAGVVPGFQNSGGSVQADLLRLNMAIPPSAKENPAGLVAGDPAGYPNGRRIGDNIVAIEINAIAGATLPLVDPSFMPDGPAAKLGLTDGTTPDVTPLGRFPYMPYPHEGFSGS